LNAIDDHSRFLVGSEARVVFKAGDVVACFHEAAAVNGYPAELLTDNGAVFTAAPRGGRCALELECDRLGIRDVTRAPVTPRPAARSSGSTRRSRSGSPSRTLRPRSRDCRPSSTPSASTTTRSRRTARSAGALRRRSTAPDPRTARGVRGSKGVRCSARPDRSWGRGHAALRLEAPAHQGRQALCGGAGAAARGGPRRADRDRRWGAHPRAHDRSDAGYQELGKDEGARMS
jgi:hypothetical protein